MYPVNPPFPIFTDVDGQPLEDGFIYIGVANENPEVQPISVFWDASGTIPAAQPIRTSGGYPVRNGTPAVIYCNSEYSITVRNKNGSFIYSAPTSATGITTTGRTIYVPSLPGVDPTGVNDSTDALTAAAADAQDGDTFDFGGGIYLVSYKGAAYSSTYGNVVMNFVGKRDISLLGNGATIKINNHNITLYGGLTFLNFKGSKRIRVSGFNFDMTFQGLNTSSLYYPFCGAITGIDTNSASPDFETINSDFIIEGNTFKLFHPYGNWATSGNPIDGDPNNGYKLFSIFMSGPYSPTSYDNQCRNLMIRDNTWKKGHNGYGIWFWSWNNCRVVNNVAEAWVTKYSTPTGAFGGAGVAWIRNIPFYTEGVVIEGNNMRSMPNSERTLGSGFEGSAQFYVQANNQGDIDSARGMTIVANNDVILGTGYAPTWQDEFVFFNAFGQLVIEGNNIDGHDGQTVTPGVGGVVGIYYDTKSNGGNGVASLTVNGNNFGPWFLGAAIVFFNGSSVSEYRRRCKQLIVTNNTQASGDFFLRMVDYSYATYEGCRYAVIANNVIDGTIPGAYPPPSGNNYGMAIAATQSTDTIIATGNVIVNKTYDMLTLSAFISASANFKRWGNNIKGITSPYYAANVFPTDVVDGSAQVIARSSDGNFQPYVRCINEQATPSEVQFYQQTTASYIIASNVLNTYAGGVAQTVTDSNVFRPAADNTKTLGGASYRWSVVYAGTGTINTSDERAKADIQDIDAAVLRAWSNVNYMQFKFADAVQQKGDGARWHFGLIAQRVKEAFEAEGLDAFKYGLLCYDEWADQYTEELVEVEETLPSGKTIKVMRGTGKMILTQPAGNRYGIRYEEALALECAYLRSKIAAL